MKFLRSSLAALLIFSMASVSTGCFGSFQLTRNFYQWHDSTFDNKFVKSLLYYIPFSFVYGITIFVDFIALNLIEFWSGSNPISMNEGDYEMEHHNYAGIDYKVEATKNQFKITQMSGDELGKVTVVRFDDETTTWFYENDNSSIALMSFEESNGTEFVNVFTPAGEKVRFDANRNYSKEEIASIYENALNNSLLVSK
jgi:hypothetical protein